MPEVSDDDYRILQNYKDELRQRLTDPKDRSRQIRINIQHPINQDSWTVLILQAWFDDDTKEWRQQYVQDVIWKDYQGFDVLDVSNVSFAGPRVRLELPHILGTLGYPRANIGRVDA